MIDEIIGILQIKKLPIEICNMIISFYLKFDENIKKQLNFYKGKIVNLYLFIGIKKFNYHTINFKKRPYTIMGKNCFKCGNYRGGEFFCNKIEYSFYITNDDNNSNFKILYDYFFNYEKYILKKNQGKNIKKIMCNCITDKNYTIQLENYMKHVLERC